MILCLEEAPGQEVPFLHFSWVGLIFIYKDGGKGCVIPKPSAHPDLIPPLTVWSEQLMLPLEPQFLPL